MKMERKEAEEKGGERERGRRERKEKRGRRERREKGGRRERKEKGSRGDRVWQQNPSLFPLTPLPLNFTSSSPFNIFLNCLLKRVT